MRAGPENLCVRLEADNGAATVRSSAQIFELVHGMAALKTLAISAAVARDVHLHPFRERIHDGCADAMQASRRVVDGASEFSARVKRRHDHFERRFVLELRMRVDRDTA